MKLYIIRSCWLAESITESRDILELGRPEASSFPYKAGQSSHMCWDMWRRQTTEYETTGDSFAATTRVKR